MDTQTKEKIENYWYHYKWHTIAGVVVLFLMLGFIYDVFIKPKPDMTIMVATAAYLSEEQLQAIGHVFQERLAELSENGNVNVATNYIHLDVERDYDNPSLFEALTSRLTAEMTLSETLVWILDEQIYNYINEERIMFEDLEVRYAEKELIAGAAPVGDKIYFDNGTFLEIDSHGKFPDSIFISLRRLEALNKSNTDKAKSSYLRQSQVLDAVIIND